MATKPAKKVKVKKNTPSAYCGQTLGTRGGSWLGYIPHNSYEHVWMGERWDVMHKTCFAQFAAAHKG